jgi:hypothetical protein
LGDGSESAFGKDFGGGEEFQPVEGFSFKEKGKSKKEKFIFILPTNIAKI